MKIMGESQMGKLSNIVNHSNKLMLTYFFCAVFANLYFKTKHSNETFHLGFQFISNVFSYRKHISSKSNISALTISGKSRNIKIHSPQSLLSTILWYISIFPEGHFIMTLPHFKIFFRDTHPLFIRPLPLQISTEEYLPSNVTWNRMLIIKSKN